MHGKRWIVVAVAVVLLLAVAAFSRRSVVQEELSVQRNQFPYKQPEEIEICVVARTYINQINAGYLNSFVYSIIAQPHKQWRMYLVDTGKEENATQTADALDETIEKVGDPRIIRSPTARIPEDADDDYGFAATDREMARLRGLRDEGNVGCDYFLVTNGDNIYTVWFMEQVTIEASVYGGPCIVSAAFGSKGFGVNDGALYPGHIDLGAGIFRSDFMENLTFVGPWSMEAKRGYQTVPGESECTQYVHSGSHYCDDGLFLWSIAKKYEGTRYEGRNMYSKLLMVHQ